MLIKTKALVLREQNIGENDKIVTLLTADRGILRAFVKIAGKSKSSLQSATQLLAYSDFTVNIGKTVNRIREAETIELYFGIRTDMEKVALAQYFIQLVAEASPSCADSDELLRIILNSLYFLHKSSKNKNQLKAIVEMRVVCFCGYEPDLMCCNACGSESAEKYFFDYIGGKIFCENCRQTVSGPHAVINRSVLAALRYIVFSRIDRLFSFSMSDEGFKALSEITEGYALTQLEHEFTALEFYKSICEL